MCARRRAGLVKRTKVAMFAGHIGAAMAVGRAERRVNLGVLVLAAVLLDLALWLFVLLGWESVTIPANFTATHQPEFAFPYSHGLLASIGWSVLAGLATFLFYPRLNQAKVRAAVLVAAAVSRTGCSTLSSMCPSCRSWEQVQPKWASGFGKSCRWRSQSRQSLRWRASTFSCPARGSRWRRSSGSRHYPFSSSFSR